MSNDTSTLSGALLEMKDQLIYELGQKGVTASYDSSTGLLGLIGRISDIQTGGSCYHIEFSEDSYVAVGGSATLEVYLQSNYQPLSGATVTVTGSDSSLYTGITNSQGIAEITVSNITGTVSFTASYSNVTDTCTVTGASYLFYDACDSASGLSNYGTSVLVRGSTATCSLTYDSTNNCYDLIGSGNYHSAIPIPILNDKDNYSVEADFKCSQNNELTTTGFVIRDYNDTSIQSTSFQLKGNGVFRKENYVIGSDKGYTQESISYSPYTYWVHMRLEITGASVKVELSYDGTIFKTYNYTTETITNRQLALFLYCERGTTNSKCYVRNIKAEAL